MKATKTKRYVQTVQKVAPFVQERHQSQSGQLDGDNKPQPLGHDPRVKDDPHKKKLTGASKPVCHKCGRAGHYQRAYPQGTKAEGAAAKVFTATVDPAAAGDFQRLSC